MIASYRRPTPARPAQASADARPFLRWQPPAVDRFIPAVFRQNESSCMPRQHRASAQIVGSLSRFIRHHVDIFPVLVACPFSMIARSTGPNSSPIALKCGPYRCRRCNKSFAGVTNRKLTPASGYASATAGKCRAGSTWTVSSSLAGTACCQSASVISARPFPSSADAIRPPAA